MIEKDPYVGRLATGRVATGRVRTGDRLRVIQHPDGGGGGGRGGAAVVDDLRVTRIEKRWAARGFGCGGVRMSSRPSLPYCFVQTMAGTAEEPGAAF
jgi:hypothetical protein